MDAQVRQFDNRDLASIAQLLASLGYPASPEAVRIRIAKLVAGAVCTILVAEDDGSIVGLVAAQLSQPIVHDRPIARIIALVVAEHARRIGIGMRLTDAVESWARDHGAGFISLATNNRRVEAHAFYRRAGYEETGRRFVKRL